ncbi:ATP-binding protein [Lichenicola sp.]|uniref:ATP-binding protein n=1 Tax=Lichenicola sp. TaxID=2804529 RepID=UPI003B00D8CE
MSLIVLVGISGVGKSTFLDIVSKKVDFHHFVASKIIRDELVRQGEGDLSSEELRLGAILDNQRLLANGFLHEAAGTTLPIILDGHVLIDGKDGIVPIPAETFRRIGAKHMVFLQDEPDRIRLRRSRDEIRSRPARTVEQLEDQQDYAIKTAAVICRSLSIDMLLLTPAMPEVLERLLHMS